MQVCGRHADPWWSGRDGWALQGCGSQRAVLERCGPSAPSNSRPSRGVGRKAGRRVKSAPPQTDLPCERLVCQPTARREQEEAKWCSFFGCLNPGVESFICRSSGDVCTVPTAPAEQRRRGEICSSVLLLCSGGAFWLSLWLFWTAASGCADCLLLMLPPAPLPRCSERAGFLCQYFLEMSPD